MRSISLIMRATIASVCNTNYLPAAFGSQDEFSRTRFTSSAFNNLDELIIGGGTNSDLITGSLGI